MKQSLVVLAILIISFGAGWLTSLAKQRAMNSQMETLRARVREARGQVVRAEGYLSMKDAHISLTKAVHEVEARNFGHAQEHIEAARYAVGRVAGKLPAGGTGADGTGAAETGAGGSGDDSPSNAEAEQAEADTATGGGPESLGNATLPSQDSALFLAAQAVYPSLQGLNVLSQRDWTEHHRAIRDVLQAMEEKTPSYAKKP